MNNRDQEVAPTRLKTMKKLLLLIPLILGLIYGHAHIFGSSDGTDEPTTTDGWVYGKIEYPHDVLTPRDYFLLLRAHPQAKVPMITGGYATTDVYVHVRLRGISIPRALQNPDDRHRPHIYIDRERQRWNTAMQYVWNTMQPNRTFRVGNFAVLETDQLLEADIEFLLGGTWINLANTMINDEIARTPQEEFDWDWGTRGIGPTNPNIPQ